MAMPVVPLRVPLSGLERRRDTRGFNYVVRFDELVTLEDGREPTKTVWFNASKGERAEEAKDEAWQWLQAVLRMYARQHAGSEGASLPDGFAH